MAEPKRYEGFAKGMDNRRSNFDGFEGLRDALNCDIQTSGKPRRRVGILQRIADAGAHSIWNDGAKLLWATSTTVKSAVPGNFAPTTLYTDSRLAKPLSWVTLHGITYFSNEDVNGVIDITGAYHPWGIVPPSAPPVCTGDGGNRIVMVTCTFVMSSGEESGAPIAVACTCSDSPSIQVSSIPQSTDARVVATRLYVTPLDSDEFYREVDVPAGTTSTTLRGFFATGQQLITQFMQNMPPGQLLEYHNGTIYTAINNILVHTDPLRYNLWDNNDNFFEFPNRITLLKSVPHGPSRSERPGMFVGSDKTYFLSDIGTDEVDQKVVLGYGAVEGAAMHVPNSDHVLWLSAKGIERGVSGGKVEHLTEDQIAMDVYARACLGMVERSGHRALVAIAQSSVHTPLLSSDWIANETERKQIVE